MSNETQTAASTTTLTRGERQALRALRSRYRQDRDLLSERERAHLRFVRWLYQTGRLES